jgi:hypothetical protein
MKGSQGVCSWRVEGFWQAALASLLERILSGRCAHLEDTCRSFAYWANAARSA